MSLIKIKKIRGCTACDVSERGDQLRLEKLEVSVFFRDQGIGSQMIEQVKSLGKPIQLYPEGEPGRSRDLKRFYRRHGFKPCRDGYWRWFPALVLALLMIASAQAAPPPGFAEKMADAIYIAEGGAKTRYPYGVKSIKTRNAAHARQITINSINNNWRRWEQAAKPGEFVTFMATRWCPPSADPLGNKNWIKNVNRLMK